MKQYLLTLVFTAVLGTWGQLSQATIIGFEESPTLPNKTELLVTLTDTPVTSGGFQFTSPSNHIHRVNQAINLADSGSTNLFIHDNSGFNTGNSLKMVPVDGLPFSISGVSLAEGLFKSSDKGGFIGNGAKTVLVVGNKLMGSPVTQSFDLNNTIDGPGGVGDFETFTFNTSFVGLTSVVFSGVGGNPDELAFSIDCISVNGAGAGTGTGTGTGAGAGAGSGAGSGAGGCAVPEPSALALLGLGLAGVGFIRRKKS